MTNEQFDALVTRLERLGAEHPAAYRFRVFLLAALGYGFLFAILAVLLGAIVLLGVLAVKGHGSAFTVKMALPLLVVIWLVLRALWVRLDAPEGIRLTSADAPAMFAEIDDLRRKLRGPRIHEVVLNEEFNAAITQIPRLGVFGWQKNYLLLGLPLMQALSPGQFRAVLAHEYGHVAGAHGKFGAWIYRVRQTWHQLLEAMEKREGWLVNVFKRFFQWYSPFFSAYSFVLARAQEYEADRCAAQVAGRRPAAEALLNMSIKGGFLREAFWPEIYKRVEVEAVPDAAPHRFMSDRINQPHAAIGADKYLEWALSQKTGTADTHPALSDRLQALGERPHLPAPVMETAAQRLLGAALPEHVQCFDLRWRENIAQSWKERHEYVRDGKSRLAELHAKAGAGELTLREAWDRAALSDEFESAEQALPLYQAVLARAPEDPSPLFAVGRLLLAAGDAAGLPLVEKAAVLDARLAAPGAEWIAQFHETQGRGDDARTWWQRAFQLRQAQTEAAAEREALTSRDHFLPHGLEAEAIAALNAQLREYPDVVKAYLVRKAVKHDAEKRPLFVLGVAYPSWHFKFNQRKAFAQKLASELNLRGESFVLVVNGSALGSDAETEIGRRMRKVKESLIYRR
ncbi:MAG: M48 family metalloprotease [Burkholderiales bacterium]